MAGKKARSRRRTAAKRKTAKQPAKGKTRRRRTTGRKPARKAGKRKAAQRVPGKARRAAGGRGRGDLLGPPPAEALLSRDDRERLAAEALRGDAAASPVLTGGDVDADWRRAASVGEEAVGGSVPTPDQDVVDDLGEALGVPRAPEESFRSSQEILEARDARRARQEG